MTALLLEREAQVAALEALTAAARGGAGRLVTIEGGAGIGKSRLLGEARSVGGGPRPPGPAGPRRGGGGGIGPPGGPPPLRPPPPGGGAAPAGRRAPGG